MYTLTSLPCTAVLLGLHCLAVWKADLAGHEQDVPMAIRQATEPATFAPPPKSLPVECQLVASLPLLISDVQCGIMGVEQCLLVFIEEGFSIPQGVQAM